MRGIRIENEGQGCILHILIDVGGLCNAPTTVVRYSDDKYC